LRETARRVAARRQALGLGLERAGAQCGVSANRLSAIEDEQNHSLSTLVKVILGFGMYDFPLGKELVLIPTGRAVVLSEEETGPFIASILGEFGTLVTRARGKLTFAAASELCAVSGKHLFEVEHGKNLTIAVLTRVICGLKMHDVRLGAPRQVQGAATAAVSFIGSVASNRKGENEEFAPFVTSTLERVRSTQVTIAGEISSGKPIRSVSGGKRITLPEYVVEQQGEEIYRVSDDSLREWGFEAGDLIIVERRSHAANGELVLALRDGKVIIGRYWSKRGQAPRLISSDSQRAIATEDGMPLLILGAINSSLRERKP
jgi:SOS-response transcriptional repressor LexA